MFLNSKLFSCVPPPCWLEQKTMEVSISQTLRFLSLLSTVTDFYIISAELDFIPSTRLGFRRAVPEFLRSPFAFVVADRVIKSGLKSQSNPPTMRRMRATICESRRGDRRTACNTCSVELMRYPAVVENICRITIAAIVRYGILPK